MMCCRGNGVTLVSNKKTITQGRQRNQVTGWQS